MTIEQRAEDIVRSMVPESWNGSIEIIAALLRELELARRVADAAAAVEILDNAVTHIGELHPWRIVRHPCDEDAVFMLLKAKGAAVIAQRVAVAEYRASVEAAAISMERGDNDRERN